MLESASQGNDRWNAPVKWLYDRGCHQLNKDGTTQSVWLWAHIKHANASRPLTREYQFRGLGVKPCAGYWTQGDDIACLLLADLYLSLETLNPYKRNFNVNRFVDFLWCYEGLEIIHEDLSVVFGDGKLAWHLVEASIVQFLIERVQLFVKTFALYLIAQLLKLFERERVDFFVNLLKLAFYHRIVSYWLRLRPSWHWASGKRLTFCTIVLSQSLF